MVTKVKIVEVGPRDGFQMESFFIPTETKVQIINQIARAGIKKIEATSFVHPNVIPQLRDARDVIQRIDRFPDVCYLALVPNFKGAQNALDAGVDGIKIVVAVTEASNQKNIRMSVSESLRMSEQIMRLASETGKSAEVVLSVAFGCPFEGDTPDSTILTIVDTLSRIGFREVSVADTVGIANPSQVERISTMLLKRFPEIHFSLHFHNTRGLGLPNVLAGMQSGIDQFDSSIGGLGGCPVVRGGIGNVSTEDLVNMLHEMNIETGVSLEGIIRAARAAQDVLQRPLTSYLLSAGTKEQLYTQNRDTQIHRTAN